MSNNKDDLSKITFDFSKFMQVEKKLAEEKPKVEFKEQVEENPNKEYVKRYYENSVGRMWIGRPRYR